MKYKIDIKSRNECIIFSTRDLKEDCVIISINNTGYDTNILKNKNIIDICKLWFDDIDNEKYEDEDLKLMNIKQAIEIKNFVEKHKSKVKHIVIHCSAGISRSAAVGCVIAGYLNNTDNYLWQSGRYMPNKHVYKIMCEVFNLKYSDKMFKQKMNMKYKRDKLENLSFYSNYGVDLDDMFSN